MAETENKNDASKRPIPAPKPDDQAPEAALRDETQLYGDEADIPRRRKRTDARVPIMRDRAAAKPAM